ncbi:glycosyltransferase [Leeuwenhoekiella aequorea]|uniref:Glycosyltransferase involved in cell wall biosynthesis n=1 Tax=Leeuwenhoekiella aequorea TaxID=283736 RepID=A0A4Q0P320_9FLAO|nr:glycosyltransferase [Leeuwenhoekiella aequorea]RXG20448.1 glycosyltransferase involved in cell wall biosynthesis [Leeuwenhoekiella aequorea]
MKVLFFDIQSTGHHSEYIDHIATYLQTNKPKGLFIFVVNTNFYSDFSFIVDKTKDLNNVFWKYVEGESLKKIFRSNLIRRSFLEYSLMMKYAKKYNVDEIIALYFNTLQISCILKRDKYRIKGILFQQFSAMDISGVKNNLKYFRKKITTLLYLKNSRIKSIFILNDAKSVKSLNTSFNTHIFKTLPDPIPKINISGHIKFDDFYKGISKEKLIYLHFGGLSDRKGTLECIEACSLLPSALQNKICLLIVGKSSSEEFGLKISETIEKAKKLCDVQILWYKDFVTNEMMKITFNAAHIVLMTNKNTEASSGILGHAVASNRKIIALDSGLIKRLVENYRIGFLISDITPNEIANAIISTLDISEKEVEPETLVFLNERNPLEFAHRVIYN